MVSQVQRGGIRHVSTHSEEKNSGEKAGRTARRQTRKENASVLESGDRCRAGARGTSEVVGQERGTGEGEGIEA